MSEPIHQNTANSSIAEKGEHGRRIAHALTPGGHPIDSTQPGFNVYHRRFANPAPLGLMAFAATTLLLSFINVGTRGISVNQVVTGMAFGYGGLAQLLAGQWEFATGNTFGATAFSSYGAFWISFGYLISPWSGAESAYTELGAEGETMLGSAIGLYLFTWGIVTFILLVAALRSSVALVGVFFFLTITFFLLGAGFLHEDMPAITTAGGAFGIITAFNAFYVAAAGLLTPDTSYFVLPVGELKRD